MKFIITEDKLYKSFTKFMDKFVGLTYRVNLENWRGRVIRKYIFITKEDNTFGNMVEDEAFFPSYSEYEKIDDFFGKKTDELLLQYLKDKFGDKILFRQIA